MGSNFGAGQINAITQAVNESADATKIIEDAEDCDAVTEDGFIASAKALGQVNRNLGGLRFGVDGDGNYGYYGADDSLIPFSSVFWAQYTKVAEDTAHILYTGPTNATITTDYTAKKDCKYIIFSYMDRPLNITNYQYSGSGEDMSLEDFQNDTLFARLMSACGGFNEKWSIRSGEAKAGEIINATMYGYTNSSGGMNLYNVIFTDENI